METEITETNTTQETTSSTTGYDQYFTEVEEGLNIVAHNLKAECITSTNDKFSLDSDGNLIVNSVTTSTQNEQSLNFDEIYPIGSIYMNVNAVEPSSLFGGTWEKLENMFLIGASSNYALGVAGGSATHTHPMPHKHSRGNLTAAINMDSSYIRSVWSTSTTGANAVTTWKNNARKTVSGTNADNAVNQTEGTPVYGQTGDPTVANTSDGSSMPPYLPVNMWKRIS